MIKEINKWMLVKQYRNDDPVKRFVLYKEILSDAYSRYACIVNAESEEHPNFLKYKKHGKANKWYFDYAEDLKEDIKKEIQVQDLKTMNRDYVWMEVKGTNEIWAKRAVIGMVDGKYEYLAHADNDEHDIIDMFLKGKKYLTTYLTDEVREIKEPIWKPFTKLTDKEKNILRSVWIKSKSGRLVSNIELQITEFDNIQYYVKLGSYGWQNLQHLFDNFVFLDGTPIGIKE